MGGNVLGPGTAQGISSSALSVVTLKGRWLLPNLLAPSCSHSAIT